jgi:hypothetical protein
MSLPFRHWLARAGQHMSFNTVRGIKGLAKYVEVGYMLRQMGYTLDGVNWQTNRDHVWDVIVPEIANRQVLYLEFGVFQGGTTRYWSSRLKHPGTKLHGFDSFEGLPEDWPEVKRTFEKGHFSTGGAVPVIDDPRVQFFKGWFEETLPSYKVPEHEVLIVDFDADLYSSTKCVFQYIGPHIVPGSYLYFDEFNCVQDELRAFREYSASTQRKFALRAATLSLTNVLFQCVA